MSDNFNVIRFQDRLVAFQSCDIVSKITTKHPSICIKYYDSLSMLDLIMSLLRIVSVPNCFIILANYFNAISQCIGRAA